MTAEIRITCGRVNQASLIFAWAPRECRRKTTAHTSEARLVPLLIAGSENRTMAQ